MTIENSEDTAQVSVPDPVPEPVIEPASSSTEPVDDGAAKPDLSSVKIEVARNLSTHDSAPPMSRKLAPPPKPKRDSGMASSMPPPQAGEVSPDLLASSSALKAPIAPTISYSADDTAKMHVTPELPEPPAPVLDPAPPPAPAPLSQPPPIRRRSSPSFSALDGDAKALGAVRTPSDPGFGAVRTPSDPSLGAVRTPSDPGLGAVRTPSDPSLATTEAASRPIAAPPRPRSDPPPPRPREPSITDEAAPVASAPASAPPSTSAIFAMRIIAVGDAARAPVSQDGSPDLDPNAYPPSASRLGTGVRRSSRPAATAAANVPVEMPAAARLPTAVTLPVATAASEVTGPEIVIEDDIPIEVEPPITKAPSFPPVTGAPAFPPLSAASAPPPPVVQVRPPPPPPPVELGAPPTPPPPAPPVELAAVPIEELRPPPPPPKVDLGAVPPEELHEVLAAVEATSDASNKSEAPVTSAAADGVDGRAKSADAEEELGREDAISLPPEELAGLKAELDAKAEAVKPPPPPKRTTGALNVAPPAETAPKEPPPTPDPAAAKAAQRAKTRQPWWEDLFSEDFMRASVRVSDEQVRREVTFIEESLGVAAGGVVLDLGCGSGHHAVEFASRGYGVVGYDLSLYQLALAADVAQERSQKINFLQGDMREMAFEEMFDGVFCWNTTFGYFEEDKNLAVAQRVFKALRPGGMFLIDVLNRDFAAASAPCSVWYEGDSCVCMDDMSVDYISSRLRVKRSIILDDGRTKEALYSLRLYSLHELGKLLHEVGFRVTEASGHPSTPGVFFGPNSPRIIMLAQRP